MVKRIKNKIHLGVGRLRRVYLSYFRRNYVNSMISKRKGQCNQCGACCRLLFKCPFLIDQGTSSTCRIYGKVRPVICAVFPINEKDISDRNRVLPDIKCGYFFELKEKLENQD